jgi:hypothetical protein
MLLVLPLLLLLLLLLLLCSAESPLRPAAKKPGTAILGAS